MPPKEQEEEKYDLPAETAKAFAWAPGQPPVFEDFNLGKIDIRSVTPQKAKQIIEAGLPHIVALDQKADKPAKQV